jgi:ACS family hexuronate transporter-like MFS transporter
MSERSATGSLQTWTLALVATLTMAVSYADRQAFAVLAPAITRALNIDDTAYGWLLSSFSFAYLIGAPLGGRLIDRVGPRRGLTAAVLVWSGVAALHAFVPGLAVLFVLRISLGLAEAPSFPGAAKVIHLVLPAVERPRGFGLLFIGSSLGAMVVAPLSTALEHRYGFRLALLCTAVVGLGWLPLWIAVTTPATARAALDSTAAPSKGPERAGIATMLRHPALLRAVLVILATSPTMSYGLNWSSKYLVAVFHLPLQEAGQMLWLPPVLYDIGSLGFGFAASAQLRRLGHSAPPPQALVAVACALATSLALLPFISSPWAATVIIGFALAGGGGLFALTTADLLARVPANAVSTCAGLTAAAQSVAYIVASPMIGWGVQHQSHAFDQRGLAGWLLPGCVAWLLWTPPSRVTEQANLVLRG